MQARMLRLESKIWKLRSVFERTTAPHCARDVSTVMFHLSERFMEVLERFQSLLTPDLAPFHLCSVPTKQFFNLTSTRFVIKVQHKVHIVGTAVYREQRPESEVP